MIGWRTACRSFPSVEVLELEPHLERALARRLESTSADVVDEPESARELTIRASGFGRSDTGAGRVLHFRAIENVLEVHPDGERHPLTELEDPPQAHGFRWPPLITVVVVVWRTRAKLSVCGVRPRCRIEHEILRRIDAVAVQILQERRYSWDAVDKGRGGVAGSGRPLKQQIVQVIRGRRRQNGKPAGVAH